MRSLGILDRTKEPGATGEPLLLDVISALADAVTTGTRTSLPRIIGGRYGLGSKELTPAMVKAAFDELDAERPRTRFTLGITDDVTGLSLPVDEEFDTEPAGVSRAVFYGLGSDGTVSANKATIKIIGDATEQACQGYFVLDSKKAGSTTVSHLRFGPAPIRSTYQIRRAGFLAVHDPGFLDRFDVLDRAGQGAAVLLNTTVPPEQVWAGLPCEAQETLLQRGCHLFVIDAYRLADEHGLGRRINTVMQACFFALSDVLPVDEALTRMKQAVTATWGKRGSEIVRRNTAAIDAAVAALHEIPIPDAVDAVRTRPPAVPADAPDFVRRVTGLLLEGHGDRLPVSAFPPDGTWPTGTSKFEKRAIALDLPIWEPDLCVQCNRCSMICPHTAILTKVFQPEDAAAAPSVFRSTPEGFTPELEGLAFTVQVAPDDCTGCGLCVEVCPAKDRTQPRRKALNLQPAAEHRATEREAFAFYQQIPEVSRARIPRTRSGIALLEPLFEFCGACAGCGETPYLRLLTQLVGDRLLIANATGCSSIYGGNLPTSPYTTDANGRGPAWNNSLFEDNAEFGLGLRLGADTLARRAHTLLDRFAPQLAADLVGELTGPCPSGDDAAIGARREAVTRLRALLAEIDGGDELARCADTLVPRSVWLVGGDGWAYDIGFGGLDHVLASRHDVNVLVLDTEVYSNTGGQQSKATPLGAVAKFASAGKETSKKDLGLLAMSYGHVYVASVAMQSHTSQTLTALQEAESYPGPSIVIAHSPCIAHGYDLVNAPAQQRRAVGSGAWPLFRFDPRRIETGESPLVIDADPVTVPLRNYLEQEARFRMVELADPQRYERLVAAGENAIARRHALYQQLAGIHLPTQED
ncbi:pyruvate:ferredoxin (flavodoxin) oxidoreductase [Mycobacterium innocens]|uniref:pyruvate:ferredoxin (flavodoxin) oxidoreductase n=1 Tax=Mycobacterium innocens TaxID=2341083 RepID=UPI002AA59260|nr:pyruvate:ferredoxin (flavodoxin) oxidoreductase [Mycobacterium kansasii]